ncbi:hypothetical protein ACJJTC_017792 [Scirpophaga incertulas]
MASPNSQSLISESSIVTLIEQVEKRPALYKKNLKEYSDVNVKKKLWEEVCEAVVPDWNELSAQEKTNQGRDIQKKWANLRTCFRRELNAQKNTKSGQASVKRRKYVYFEQLLFLLPCMENRQTEGNLNLAQDTTENEEDDEETAPSASAPPRQKKTRVSKNTDLDEAILKALNQTNVDEDVNFALSLVPSLKNLTADEKLDAKISILNVFKQIRLGRRVQPHSQPTYTILQQPMNSFPVYQRETNILPPQQQLQAYASGFTPSPTLPQTTIQNVSSPADSNMSAQSYYSNFEDSQIYDL